VGLVQRVLEKSGLVTISLTNMPFVTEKIGVPRAAAIEFPFGMIWGRPGDGDTHLEILRSMLDALETIDTPGTVIELPFPWPEEEFRKRDWFPTEPTPWASSPEAVNEMLEFIQHGNPLE
jgi:D-proline reductase (dithiol) PrdB